MRKVNLAGLILTALLLYGNGVRAEFFDGCCCWKNCPPKYVHCQEGPPRICFKQDCAKPVCDPCNLPCAGYFQNHWRPWPWPLNFSHCFESRESAEEVPGAPARRMPEAPPPR